MIFVDKSIQFGVCFPIAASAGIQFTSEKNYLLSNFKTTSFLLYTVLKVNLVKTIYKYRREISIRHVPQHLYNRKNYFQIRAVLSNITQRWSNVKR